MFPTTLHALVVAFQQCSNYSACTGGGGLPAMFPTTPHALVLVTLCNLYWQCFSSMFCRIYWLQQLKLGLHGGAGGSGGSGGDSGCTGGYCLCSTGTYTGVAFCNLYCVVVVVVVVVVTSVGTGAWMFCCGGGGYKAKSVCQRVCVFRIRAHISCSIAAKLAVVAWGIRGQVIAGLTLPVFQFAES